MGLDQHIRIVEREESVRQAHQDGYKDYEGINKTVWEGRKDLQVQDWMEKEFVRLENGECYELSRKHVEKLLVACSVAVAVFQQFGAIEYAGEELVARLLPDPRYDYGPRYYRAVLELRDALLETLFINWETTQVFYGSNW